MDCKFRRFSFFDFCMFLIAPSSISGSPDGRFSNTQVNYRGFVNRTKMAKRYFSKKYYYTCLVVRSIFFLMKTKNIRLYRSALKEIFGDTKREAFNDEFYRYVKKVNGFLYF